MQLKIVDPRKFTKVELLNTTEFRMAVVRGRKYHALFLNIRVYTKGRLRMGISLTTKITKKYELVENTKNTLTGNTWSKY